MSHASNPDQTSSPPPPLGRRGDGGTTTTTTATRTRRWGDHHSPLPKHHAPDRSRPPAQHGKEMAVLDEEALRALMASAQEREQERITASRKRGREPTTSSNNNHRNQHSSSPNRGNHNNNNNNKEQRLVQDTNDSYYGPQRGEERRTQREIGPAQVEHDDGDGKAPANTKTPGEETEEEKKPPIYKPNFGLSGALSKDTGNSGSRLYKGVILKFQEPLEARAPNTQWRFYVFKENEHLETLHISKQSAYLCGRHQDICDIYMAHPSLSSQHAVLQYRALPNDQGRLSCQPYILDLESTNGTFLNGVRIDSARYYQLKKGDVLTFGASKREYVLLTENTTALR